MAEGFKVADAYVSVVSKVDRDAVKSSAKDAGDEAGKVLGDAIKRGADGKLSNAKGQFVGGGKSAGGGFLSGFMDSLNGFGMQLPKVLSNPYVAAGVAGAAVTLAPVFGAAFSGAILGGAGLGIIGLGAFLLREEPALVAAGNKLKSRITTIFKDAAKPLLGPFVESVGKITGMFDRMEPSIKKAFAAVAPAIGPLTDGLIVMAETALPGILNLIEASGPFLKDIAPGFKFLGQAISMFGDEIAKAGPDAAVFFKDLLQFIGGTIYGFGLLISWLARGYKDIRNFFTSIPGWIKSAGDWFSDLWSKIGAFFTGIGQWFVDGWNTVSTFFSNMGTGIANFVNSAVAWFAALPGRIGAFLMALPGVILNAFVWAFDQATYFIGFAIGSVVAFFIALPGRIASGLSALWSAMVGIWTSARDNTISLVTSWVNHAISWFQQLPGRASAAISNLWGSMVGHFNSARTNAINAATALVNNTVSWFQQLPGRAASALSGVKNSVLGAFSGAGSWLVDAGADMLRGIARGISSATGFVIDAAKRAAANIIDGFKDALGIDSPSKVAAKEVGRWIPPGIGVGFKKALPGTRRVLADAARSLITPVGSAVRTGGGTGDAGRGSTYHFEEGSIVLDASKMRSIQDVVELIGGIKSSARAAHARAATTPGM